MALAWKEIEKRIAEWLNSVAVPATRKSKMYMGEAVEDIEFDGFSLEVKSRGVLPKYIDQWVEQATANSDGKIPAVIWHKDGTHIGKQFIILKLSDFKKIVESWKGDNVSN